MRYSQHLGWRVDLLKLNKYIGGFGELGRAIYYVGVPQDGEAKSKQDKFLTFLSRNGYSVEQKDVKVIFADDGTETHKANLDVELVLDMTLQLPTYDHAVLVSGDGDFERALRVIRDNGKSFTVLGVDRMTAREIRLLAGSNYVDLAGLREQLEDTRQG